MMQGNIFFLFIALVLWNQSGYAYQSYRVNVTDEQLIYWQRTLNFIQQPTGKRCTRASVMAQQRFCKKRCELMFYYIPTAPYKNYRFYNKTTKDCQPRAICPPIFTVQYNSTSNKCFDLSTGQQIQSIDAQPYRGNNTHQVQFVCINGYVGMYKGRQECICRFGWKTTYLPATRQNPKYQKCNKGISIWQFFPSAVQIYYDPLLDNTYPHPADPDYWPLILIFILTSIWPNEVQLTLLAVPKQPLIRDQDMKYVYLSGSIFVFIVMLSIYQKVKNTRTMQQIIAQRENKD